METHIKNLLLMVASLLVIFAVLDFFNLTAWLLYPYSTATGKNNNLTSQIGNTPATGGGGN
jgi:hypothetical protein